MEKPTNEFYESLTIFQKFAINVLKCGPIPKHVAFILDGNRRYAKKTNISKSDAYRKGSDRLNTVVEWCLLFEMKEITAYTFSIANLQRTPEEVDLFMEIYVEQLRRWMKDDFIVENGIRFRFIGNPSYMRENVRAELAKLIDATKNHSKFTINLAFMYTSHDEMEQAAAAIAHGVGDGALQPEDIDEDLFTNCLYTSGCSNPDILIRTGGDCRSSDFLLWQTSYSQLCFIQHLWPDLTFWDFFMAIFKYQRSYKELLKNETKLLQKEHVRRFVEQLQKKRLKDLTG